MRTRKANINSREFLALESFFWSPRVLLCGSSGADVTAESASSWTTRPQGDTHIHTHTHDSNHHELTQKPTTRTQVSRRQTPVSKPRYITRSQRNALHPRRQTKFPPTTQKHTRLSARQTPAPRTNNLISPHWKHAGAPLQVGTDRPVVTNLNRSRPRLRTHRQTQRRHHQPTPYTTIHRSRMHAFCLPYRSV